jgi:hypothetical protein
VVRRQNEAVALGFVTSRVFEAAVIVIGVVSLLSVVTLRKADASGAEAASLVVTGQALVAVRDWTFLLGPGLMAGLNALLLGPGLMAGLNALLLGYLMYRSGLVPRVIPVPGLIGAPLLLASTIATLFGIHDQLSPFALVAVLPIFVWELSLGVWLVSRASGPPPSPHRTSRPWSHPEHLPPRDPRWNSGAGQGRTPCTWPAFQSTVRV